jgi:hypothetical protein
MQKKPIPHTMFKDLTGIKELPRAKMPELEADYRITCFDEVDGVITPESAHLEAHRCLRCGLVCYDHEECLAPEGQADRAA